MLSGGRDYSRDDREAGIDRQPEECTYSLRENACSFYGYGRKTRRQSSGPALEKEENNEIKAIPSLSLSNFETHISPYGRNASLVLDCNGTYCNILITGVVRLR